MTDSYFRVEIKDFVAELVLNRPNKLNTVDFAFFEHLGNILRQLEKNEDVRCVLIWAEGKLFTAGLDLKHAQQEIFMSDKAQGDRAQFARLIYHWLNVVQESISFMQTMNKPVIMAIHNKCIGAGVDLATAADIRICSKDATFAVAETKLAIVADLGTLQRLERVVGKGIAREMTFTGEPIPSSVALRSGFVNQVLDSKDDLLAAGRQLARRIAANSPIVVQGAKRVLNFTEKHGVDASLEFVKAWNSGFLQTDDLQEAIVSFVQRREPTFKANL